MIIGNFLVRAVLKCWAIEFWIKIDTIICDGDMWVLAKIKADKTKEASLTQETEAELWLPKHHHHRSTEVVPNDI